MITTFTFSGTQMPRGDKANKDTCLKGNTQVAGYVGVGTLTIDRQMKRLFCDAFYGLNSGPTSRYGIEPFGDSFRVRLLWRFWKDKRLRNCSYELCACSYNVCALNRYLLFTTAVLMLVAVSSLAAHEMLLLKHGTGS